METWQYTAPPDRAAAIAARGDIELTVREVDMMKGPSANKRQSNRKRKSCASTSDGKKVTDPIFEFQVPPLLQAIRVPSKLLGSHHVSLHRTLEEKLSHLKV